MFGPGAMFIRRILQLFGLGEVARWLFDKTAYRVYQLASRALFHLKLRSWEKSGAGSKIDDVLRVISLLRPTASVMNPIRIGGDDDGGYVVPSEIFESSALFSPGVAQSSRFELEFAKRGIRCFLADASVVGPQESHELFAFRKVFIGPRDEGQFISMQSWISSADVSTGNLALQMDIEGAEWGVLSDDSWLVGFRFLVIEFHNLENVWNSQRLQEIESALTKVTNRFECVLTVANNYSPVQKNKKIRIPSTVECTFVRKGDTSLAPLSRIGSSQMLLRPNNPRLPVADLGSIG